MRALIKMKKSNNSLLVSPMDLISILGGKEFNRANLDAIIQDLCSDGYFDLIYSDRHGERVYCITFSQKGQSYDRNALLMRRNVIFRLGLTIVLAIVSFLIGLILKAIF